MLVAGVGMVWWLTGGFLVLCLRLVWLVGLYRFCGLL